jgi:hypothetical protein
MIRDVHPGPGSRIRILIFTRPGSRIQGSKRHRIPDPDTQDWVNYSVYCVQLTYRRVE